MERRSRIAHSSKHSIDILCKLLRQRTRLDRVQAAVKLGQLGHSEDDGVAVLAVQNAVIGCPAQRSGVSADVVLCGVFANP